jgi:hypothetical protein
LFVIVKLQDAGILENRHEGDVFFFQEIHGDILLIENVVNHKIVIFGFEAQNVFWVEIFVELGLVGNDGLIATRYEDVRTEDFAFDGQDFVFIL